MDQIALKLHDRDVTVSYPSSFSRDIDVMFGAIERVSAGVIDSATVTLRRKTDEEFIVTARGVDSSFDRDSSLGAVMDEVVRALISDIRSGLVLHAGMVTNNDRAILIPGQNGSGKTSLVGWLVDRGFKYRTDEIVVATKKTVDLQGLPRGVVLKPGSAELVRRFPVFGEAAVLQAHPETIIAPPSQAIAPNRPYPCGLIVFPKFEADSELLIEPVAPAQCAGKLMECNLNARNLRDDGVSIATRLARMAPAISLRYGAYEQLEAAADLLMHFILDNGTASRRLLRALPRHVPRAADTPIRKRYPIPLPTPRPDKKSFTIGMATYDDYDGAYFSLQALRLYHGEALEDVEMVVIDNHPDGPCSQDLKKLENAIPGYRYVPLTARKGTAVRDALFEEASSDFVLCLDSHVFLVPGALRRLRDYYRNNPETADLLQGPLMGDDGLSLTATHMEPNWRQGFFGTWAVDNRGENIDAAPFEIPMQGLGLFSCRRAAWPGFNAGFRGFGGEEGYIHEKFRKSGGRVLCLPFLRWLHRFARPMGIPYRLVWEDRLYNYMIGFNEVGLPTEEMESHFAEILGADNSTRIFKSIARSAQAN